MCAGSTERILCVCYDWDVMVHITSASLQDIINKMPERERERILHCCPSTRGSCCISGVQRKRERLCSNFRALCEDTLHMRHNPRNVSFSFSLCCLCRWQRQSPMGCLIWLAVLALTSKKTRGMQREKRGELSSLGISRERTFIYVSILLHCTFVLMNVSLLRT